jgi:hypothetical protein
MMQFKKLGIAFMLFSAIFIFSAENLLALDSNLQPKTIEGQVIDRDGNPIIGATIFLKGIYWMVNLERMEDQVLQIEQVLKNNKGISGVFIRTNWKNLELNEGAFYWEKLDGLVNLCRQYGKPYKIMVLPGVNTPEWVYEKGSESFITTIPWSLRADYGKQVRIPIPWDKVYLGAFTNMLRSLGDRYCNDPLFLAITVTGANFNYGEMHLPKQKEDIKKWQSYDDAQGKIEETYYYLLDNYAKFFPFQQLCMHIVVPMPGMQTHLKRIIDYGVQNCPDRMTLQNAQLTGTQDNIDFYSYQFIMSYIGSVHIGFQSLNSFVRLPERAGNIEMAVYNVMRAKGEYWEILWPDGLDKDFAADLTDKYIKAVQLGEAAFRNEIMKKDLYRNSNKERWLIIEQLEDKGDYEQALNVLTRNFRYFDADIDKKLSLLIKMGRAKEAIEFLKIVVDKTNSKRYEERLEELKNISSERNKINED